MRAGTVTWASPSARAVLGVDPSDLVGTNTLEYIHPDDRPLAFAVRAQLGTGESARGVVARIRVGDGGYRYMSLASQPITDDAGAVVGAVAGLKDVHDLVTARMQVERERALLRASTDSMLDPQVLLEAARDEAGRIVDFTYLTVNRAASEYLRLTAQDLVGTRLLTTMPGLTEAGLLAGYIDVLETGHPYLVTGFRYRNEVLGEERYYDIRGVSAGADLLSLTWSDITERHRASPRTRGLVGAVPTAGRERVGRHRSRPGRDGRVGLTVGRAGLRRAA